jgi:lipopolysaccharide/colanic/teichoic acid biosynthesis glycosyltransferase
MLRFFDIVISFVGLCFLMPFFIVIGIIIKLTDKGTIGYIQIRIGQHKKPFRLYKFRTMYANPQNRNFLTVGNRDPRITPIGAFLRKYKIDELPQLFNVLSGQMSIVGPRPEVKHYVDYYTPKQAEIFKIKPGITDYASIIFRNENEILAKTENPEHYYINSILPRKITINKLYMKHINAQNYFRVIFLTLKGIIKK